MLDNVLGNDDDGGAVDGDVLGDVKLAKKPSYYRLAVIITNEKKLITYRSVKNIPRDITSLAYHLNVPELPALVSRVLYQQENPEAITDDTPLADIPLASFVDRDMLMRFVGNGLGHQHQTVETPHHIPLEDDTAGSRPDTDSEESDSEMGAVAPVANNTTEGGCEDEDEDEGEDENEDEDEGEDDIEGENEGEDENEDEEDEEEDEHADEEDGEDDGTDQNDDL